MLALPVAAASILSVTLRPVAPFGALAMTQPRPVANSTPGATGV